MPRYNVQTVKAAAAGRWPEIIAALCNVDPRILDGSHHPCPKCGGKDRFRFIDPDAGACLCNQCFTTKNGDGFAVIQWLTGNDFQWTIEAVGKYVGVKPEGKQKAKINPEDTLEFLPWNEVLVGLWCLKKKPIKPEAVQAVGARLAKHRGYTVIAIPMWGPSLRDGDPVGWVLYRADGGDLPRGPKDRIEWVKVKLAPGSDQGIITAGWPAQPGASIWKTEGPSDLLGLLSVQPESSKSYSFTTGSGTIEKPLEWIVKMCEGHRIAVVHDADEPGQHGATWIPQRDGGRRPGWCPTLAQLATKVVNVRLPYVIEKTHGQDIRDFFNGGGTYENLLEHAREGEEFKPTGDPLAAIGIDEHVDDPQRLARINIERYKAEHDGRLVYWRSEWLKWKEGRYKRIEIDELKAKVWAAIRLEFEAVWNDQAAKGESKPIKKVTRSLVSNVIGAMESICAVSSSIPMPCWLPDRSRPHYVATKNGLLDLDAVFANKPESECLLPHSPDWFSTFRLDYPFDPNADCPKWLEYLEYSMEGDQERINLLQEWAGYLLTSSNDLQRFLVLEGEGQNGKTVYFAAMTAMLGEDNVSHVTLENFGGRFELGTTIGKAANISGDAGEIDMVAEGVVKQFTGGDIMQFDRKNLSPISVRPTAKLMCAWNSRPRVRDKSMGLWRRMILVPFTREIPPEHRVFGMDRPGWWIDEGEAPGILLWAIVGLHRLRQQGDFTRPRVSIGAMAEYRQESNPVLRFLEENISFLPANMLADEEAKDEKDQHGINTEEVYKRYREWCEKEGAKPMTNSNFGKQMKRTYGDLKNRRGGRSDRHHVYRLLCFIDDYNF